MTVVERSSEAPPEGDREIARTMELLGGERILRRSIRSRLEAHDLIRAGLPGNALEHLVRSVEILRTPHHPESFEKALGISMRTYQRHKQQPKKALNREQSARTWKFAEVLSRATDLFGSRKAAEEWLEKPAMALDQRKPIDLLSTPAGVKALEDHLTRLEYGVYT